MHMFLEVIEGAGMIGKSIWLEPGDVCRFGSDPDIDLPLLDLAIQAEAGKLMATDAGVSLFGAAGVKLGGREAGPFETLVSGDTLSCGPFQILVCAHPAAHAGDCRSPIGELVSWMRMVRGNFYGIFDAARDGRILPLLDESKCHRLSLFDGETRARMADAAPYLVSLPKDSPALELLIRASWGRGWASFLASELDFAAVRARLRRSLMAKLPDGEVGYFRYFDPAVPQAFLPASHRLAIQDFADGLTEFLVAPRAGPDLALLFHLPWHPLEQKRIEIHALWEIGEGSRPVYERFG